MTTKVRIGPNESPAVEFISDTEIVATFMGGTLGPTDVEVETSKGKAVAENAFRAVPHPPTIVNVTPNSGAGGTRVTIRGTGFEP